MAKAIETLSIKLEFKDAGTQQIISKLSSSLKGMTNVVAGNTSPAISKLRNEILGVGKASTQSISNFRNQANALRALRDEARVGSATFKRLTEDIKKLDAQMAKASSQGRRPGARQVTQIAGAVVSGGIFGGPEGALGALGGAALGGVQGAFAGAAIGAQLAGIRQLLASVAEYGAELNKLRIALRGVSDTQLSYQQSLRVIQRTTEEFAIPQSVLTRQFTRLQASVSGAGGTVSDTEKAFKGIIAAVRATGGSLQDVDSALTATSQVFSKGKVSAEELRQQIGERLPGAFTIFADSIGLTPGELDKALEKGEVSLSDFLKFSEELFDRFYETSQKIASGPEAAGDRLKVSLERLNETVAPELTRLGAQFQTFLDQAIQGFENLFQEMGRFGSEMERRIQGQPMIDVQRKNLAEAKRTVLRTDLKPGDLAYDFALDQIAQLQPIIDAYDFVGPKPSPVSKLDQPGPKKDESKDKSTKSTLARRVEQAQALESRMQRQLLLAQSQGQIGRLLAKQAGDRAKLEERIAKLKQEGTSEELDRATKSATETLQKSQQLELQKRINRLYDQALQPLNNAIAAIKEKAAADKRYKELLAKGIKPERAKDIINLEKLKKKALERLNVEIDVLKAIVAQGGATQAQIDALDELIKKRKEAEGVDPEESTEGGSYKDEKSEFEQFKESFTAGLEDMMNVGPKLAGVAVNAIGSVTDGLIEMITTGKANFKEMTAAILKDIAKIMMQAAFAGAVKSIFGLADGGVIQGGRIQPYAKGGIVAAPTMFPMAGGDIGLMGEAGPEAIMPLKRGANGKLGVEVAGRSNAIDAMNRYSRRNTGTAGGGMASEDEAIAAVQGSAAPIDVRYTVERINSVDYVTADQFQAGMRQAANQGAKQGEQQTLKRLQMSSSTRKRVGM